MTASVMAAPKQRRYRVAACGQKLPVAPLVPPENSLAHDGVDQRAQVGPRHPWLGRGGFFARSPAARFAGLGWARFR